MSSINYTNQHLLRNEDILSTIVKSAELLPEEKVLEIGPGTGNLTKLLAETGNPIVAIESDKRLEAYLLPLEQKYNNLKVEYRNILNGFPQFRVLVANIPFNISEPLLMKMIGIKFDRAVLLIGEGLAQALENPAEEAARLPYLVNAFFNIQSICYVTSDNFNPPPATDGRVIKLTNNKQFNFKDIPSYIIRNMWKQRTSAVEDALKGTIASLSHKIGTVLFTEPLLEAMCLEDYVKKVRVIDLSNDEFTNVVYSLTDEEFTSKLTNQIVMNKHIKIKPARKKQEIHCNSVIRSKNKRLREIYKDKYSRSPRMIREIKKRIDAFEPDLI